MQEANGDWCNAIDWTRTLFPYLQQKKIKLLFAFMWVEIQYLFTTLSKVLKFYQVLILLWA